MQPSASLIEETQEHWERRMGEPVSSGDAREAASNIALFFDLLGEWDRAALQGDAQGKEEVTVEWANGVCRLTIIDRVAVGEALQ